jgi:hypothetical protein
MHRLLPLSVLLALLCFTACDSKESATYDYSAAVDMAESTLPNEYGVYAESTADANEKVALSRTETPQAPGVQIEKVNAADQRKIIFTANIQLVVDEFEGVSKAVSELAKKHGGFVARSNIIGSEGEPRRGDWTLRIPSQNFETFVDGSKALGQVKSHSQDSQEVTAEYVDLEARLRNLRVEETRLHKHLDENTRSLKDILEVEREIARVRGEIERIEGRLNVLKDLTSLSTVTLSVEEIKDYVPEATEEPGFGTQVARTWAGSIDAVGGFFTRMSLGVVGFVPWLVVVLPICLIGWFGLKRVWRQLHRTAPAVAPVEKTATT